MNEYFDIISKGIFYEYNNEYFNKNSFKNKDQDEYVYMSEKEIKILKDFLDKTKIYYTTLENGYTKIYYPTIYGYNKSSNITVFKIPDDYYIVGSTDKEIFFKCDQIEGCIKAISHTCLLFDLFTKRNKWKESHMKKIDIVNKNSLNKYFKKVYDSIS